MWLTTAVCDILVNFGISLPVFISNIPSKRAILYKHNTRMYAIESWIFALASKYGLFSLLVLANDTGNIAKRLSNFRAKVRRKLSGTTKFAYFALITFAQYWRWFAATKWKALWNCLLSSSGLDKCPHMSSICFDFAKKKTFTSISCMEISHDCKIGVLCDNHLCVASWVAL